MASSAPSPLRYTQHHSAALQSTIANGDKSQPATSTNSDTMNGTTTGELHGASAFSNSDSPSFPPPTHFLPPRPSFPRVEDNMQREQDNGLAELNRKLEGYRQRYAQRYRQQQPATLGQLPSHSGFFTGNVPLPDCSNGTSPFAGAQSVLLNGTHPLSHWLTGEYSFNRVPVPPMPPPLFTGNFPPPGPFAGGVGNVAAQYESRRPPWRQPTDNLPSPSSHIPLPTPYPPQSAREPFDIIQKAAPAVQPVGKAPTTQGRKEKKKDPKIYLPAPIASPAYLRQASLQAEVRYPPAMKLVVLDLNGTLIYRPNSRKQPKQMIARPFLSQFLAYLFDNFAVMVWSSAKPENVKVLVELGLGDYEKRLVACWGRNTLGLEPKHYNLNVQCYKNLHTIWKSDDIQRHMRGYESGARFHQHNTILIDDSSLKAAAQPHNLLEIPEFKGIDAGTQVQDVLAEVVGYLEVLKMQEDVSKFIHKDPFRANGDWRVQWAEVGYVLV